MNCKHFSPLLLSLSVLFAANASADTVSLSADVSGNSVVVDVNFDFTPDSGVIDLTWDDSLFSFDGFGATASGWTVSGGDLLPSGSGYPAGIFGVSVKADSPSAAAGTAFSFNLLASGTGTSDLGVFDNYRTTSSFYMNGSKLDGIIFEGTSATITAVPVPAAVWLFGSGLIGLAGVARRKAA